MEPKRFLKLWNTSSKKRMERNKHGRWRSLFNGCTNRRSSTGRWCSYGYKRGGILYGSAIPLAVFCSRRQEYLSSIILDPQKRLPAKALQTWWEANAFANFDRHERTCFAWKKKQKPLDLRKVHCIG